MHTTCIYYMWHKKTIWSSRIASLVKAKKWKTSFEQNFMLSNVIQSFSGLITGNFMKTIISYRWITDEDAWRYLKMHDKL